ncbi:MAG: signal peptidase II [Bullifex sp.]|nr:signal peptidase II [Spirochaetales bacterium]MDY3850194.1 signal peptidase II [Bullifex sp.]MDY4798185.1 signal peptidase II [Bullifex sp.]MDY5056626.1 signal peptidase II [Bullifex sp.]
MADRSLRRYLPLSLTALVIVLDQITKALVVAYIPENTVFRSYFGDFLEIVHVRNTAIAFSIGTGLDIPVKLVFFVVLPIILMVLVIWCVISRKTDGDFTVFQKWCLAAIAGGGIGNLIDRCFRSLRVVDWISTDMYGFLGFDRFPTYNIADAAVTVSVCLLIVSYIIGEKKK